MPTEKPAPPARAPAPVLTSLLKRVASGAGLAALIGVVFLFAQKAAGANGLPRAVVPLGIVALGGALGGVVFHYLEPLRQQSRAWKIVANVAGALGYVVIVAVALKLALTGAN